MLTCSVWKRGTTEGGLFPTYLYYNNSAMTTTSDKTGVPPAIYINGTYYPIGATVTNSSGQTGIINADGTITPQ